MTSLDAELQRWPQGLNNLKSAGYRCQEVVPDAWLIEHASARPSQDRPGLVAVGALIHGNEVGGLAVVNEVVRYLSLAAPLPFAFGLFLGNRPAALAGVRFLERDLNRSFGDSSVTKAEDKRAKELEVFFKQFSFLVDLHQTTEPSEVPFFIFPFTKRGFAFATAARSELPVITHWGDGFSKDGKCSDEYMNGIGGTGITLELGQNGFHPYQVAAGFHAVMQSLRALEYYRGHLDFEGPQTLPKVYTWSEIMPFVAADEPKLDPGFRNFQMFGPNARLGHSKAGEMVTKSGGAILFPQYQRNPHGSPPSELYRFMREIAVAELPAT